jgi:hypothetical protein
MMDVRNETAMITTLPDDIAQYDYEGIMVMAERADKLVAALNKIMNAAIKITTHFDWVLIGGKPYLQESGATKVARLFGISWRIMEGYPKCSLDSGYPSWEYRMEFRMGNTVIEAEGSRTGKDDFFTGRSENKKGADQIDSNDVKKSAYTNCLNNGIKRLLPGLRNIDVAVLEAGGVDTKRLAGYTFKEGTKGGTGKSAGASGIKCAACGVAITQTVASYSESKYSKPYCMDCQKKAAAGTLPKETAKPAATGQKPAQATEPSTCATQAKPATAVQEHLPWDGQGSPPPDDGDVPGGR